MGKQNSSGQQTIRFLLLFLASFFLIRSFFGPKGNGQNPAPVRTAPALEAAFKGIASSQPPVLEKDAALSEIQNLSTQIGGLEVKPQPSFLGRLFSTSSGDPKSSDEYSYWARFRVGLLRQYLLKDAKGAVQMYDEVAMGANSGTPSSTRLHAQAIYQKGDLLWHISKLPPPRRQEAATTLEQLVHKGRGSSQFLDMNILVPQPAPSSTKDAAIAVLSPTSFQAVRVRDLRGTAAASNLEGLPDRVDAYYSGTSFHAVFNEVVRLFGNNSRYSQGLALLFFAIALRLILQPLNKKQYASTKGMQEIAPQMKAIQEKYKEQPDKQMQAMKEIRELQKTHGVSPTMACGLGLVQMPIFFLLVYPLIQHYEARMDLTGASFLWIESLARPDYPLLAAYAFSQFLSFRLSSTAPADQQQAQMQGMMSFIMPLTIPFFLKDYPSAFTLYWMMFNIISTIFQYRMVKAHDPNHNFVQALMRSPFTATVDESLPSRPDSSLSTEPVKAGSGKKKEVVVAPSNGFNGTRDGKNGNGARNGKNGKNASVSLSKITPFDVEKSGETSATTDSPASASSNASGQDNGSRATTRNRRRRRRY
ncbi:MAG TPA: membrane protein insertase YidC [Abditibacteriaceae bacterium]|nr:membrane protein insertase YidC [Abditibacteriaceae bacterium]